MTVVLLLWEIFVLIITTTYVYYIYQTVSKVQNQLPNYYKDFFLASFQSISTSFFYIHCIRIVVTICIDTVLHPQLCWYSFTSTLVLTLCYIHTCCDTLLHPHLLWHSVTSTLVLILCRMDIYRFIIYILEAGTGSSVNGMCSCCLILTL